MKAKWIDAGGVFEILKIDKEKETVILAIPYTYGSDIGNIVKKGNQGIEEQELDFNEVEFISHNEGTDQWW